MFLPAILALSAMGGSAPLGERTYANPVYARDFPDPHVVEYRGKFYAYATESGAKGFQVMESTDLVNWTHRGTAFTVPWSRVHYWAPEVIRYRNRFYMTYSALNPETGKRDIGIAVSDNPLGQFEHKAILVRAEENRLGVIDATIFFDKDRKPYLIYSEEDPRAIVMRAMAPDLLSVSSEKTLLIRPDRPWEYGVTEAPTMVYRNGIYHLFYSASGFEGTKETCRYSVAHAWSRSLKGPYTKDDGPLLAGDGSRVYGPGHQCIVRTRAGEEWMLYHAWDEQGEPRYGSNPLGRTLRIDRLVWEGDKPKVLGPSTTPQRAPRIR